jgi:hypothetical protein
LMRRSCSAAIVSSRRRRRCIKQPVAQRLGRLMLRDLSGGQSGLLP